MRNPASGSPDPDLLQTRYVDRATGQVVAERVFGGGELRFLYGTAAGRLLVDHVLSRRMPNRVYGWLQRRGSTRARLREFVESLGVDAGEAALPLEEYASLDDFFTRTLRPGARPVAPDPGSLVSPADGRALAFPRLDGQALPVKGARVTLRELLLEPALASAYAGGAALVVRLAPADYHRFHFPEAGTAGPARRVGGRLHSVHPIALGAGAPSFRNRREITLLETSDFGRLALVEVGALCVGTIEQTYRPGPVERGGEKGTFRFGGSTVVLLAEPGRLALDDDLVANSARGLETLVRVGTRIGRSPGGAPITGSGGPAPGRASR